MPMFDCSTCGGKHRTYFNLTKCQEKGSRSSCGCPPHWKRKREEPDPKRRWNSHAPGCPLRSKGDE